MKAAYANRYTIPDDDYGNLECYINYIVCKKDGTQGCSGLAFLCGDFGTFG